MYAAPTSAAAAPREACGMAFGSGRHCWIKNSPGDMAGEKRSSGFTGQSEKRSCCAASGTPSPRAKRGTAVQDNWRGRRSFCHVQSDEGPERTTCLEPLLQTLASFDSSPNHKCHLLSVSSRVKRFRRIFWSCLWQAKQLVFHTKKEAFNPVVASAINPLRCKKVDKRCSIRLLQGHPSVQKTLSKPEIAITQWF